VGPVGPGGWAGAGGPERVGPLGSAQSGKVDFVFFLKYIFSAKEFQRNSGNSFKALKILRKSQNPNKAFGALEKGF
jgi:hypothetical protein